jgi:co-chaperonin GroES (HSP10)
VEQSKYLEAFVAAGQEGKNLFQLVGDCLLVELIKDEEFKTKSGIILQTELSKNQNNGLYADKPTFVRVLLVGNGYFDTDEDGKIKDVPLESKAGDIVLVGRTSIKQFSVFGKLVSYGETQIGLVREADVQLRFNGQEGFDRFFEIINSSLEGKVPGGKPGV